VKHWSVQDAKARFSELLRAAEKQPQRITVRGKPAAVLLSDTDYRRLCGESERSKRTFAEWWKSAPRAPELKLPRRGHGRLAKVGSGKTEARKKPKSLTDVLLAAPRVRGFKLPPRV